MTKNQPPIQIRAMQPTSADAVLFQECFERNGFPRDLSLYRWQYLENPTGKLFVEFASDRPPEHDELAAIYAVMPVRFRAGGDRCLAVQSLDTMTDSRYRGRGLFVRMAQQTFKRCQDAGVALVYGFPNGSSAHGFFTRLEWVSLDPVPFLIRPLRTRYLLSKVGAARLAGALPDIRLPLGRPRLTREQEFRVLTEFDESCTAVWERFSSTTTLAVERDADYLNWRFGRKPQESYRILGLYDAGKLVAFVVFCVKEKHGGKVGYVMELLHEPDAAGAAGQLMRAALAEMARGGADVALAWSLEHSPNHGAFRKSGFLPLPEMLRPIELHFGVRRLAAPENVAVGNRGNWYISYADSDTV